MRHITRLLKYWRNLHGGGPNSMILTTLVGQHAPGDGAYRTLDHALAQTMTSMSKWLADNLDLFFGIEIPNPALEEEDLARGWSGAHSFHDRLKAATELAKEAICSKDEQETIELWNAPDLFDGRFPKTVRGLGEPERDAHSAMESGSLSVNATGTIGISGEKDDQRVPDNGGFYGRRH